MRRIFALSFLFFLAVFAAWPADAKYKKKPIESSKEMTLTIKREPTSLEQCANLTAANEDGDAALEACNAAVAQAPENGDAYYYRGFAFFHLDRVDDAAADYSKAIELKTRFLAESYYQRGTCRELQGRLHEAAADFKKALDAKPDWSAAKRKVDEYAWAYD